jgi:hypothetical protein
MLFSAADNGIVRQWDLSACQQISQAEINSKKTMVMCKNDNFLIVERSIGLQ